MRFLHFACLFVAVASSRPDIERAVHKAVEAISAESDMESLQSSEGQDGELAAQDSRDAENLQLEEAGVEEQEGGDTGLGDEGREAAKTSLLGETLSAGRRRFWRRRRGCRPGDFVAGPGSAV